MILVQYYEMLPIDGKIIRHDIFELCDSKFRVKRNLTRDEAEEMKKNCRMIYQSHGRAIYQQ